jgi:hypothetical protein
MHGRLYPGTDALAHVSQYLIICLTSLSAFSIFWCVPAADILSAGFLFQQSAAQ